MVAPKEITSDSRERERETYGQRDSQTQRPGKRISQSRASLPTTTAHKHLPSLTFTRLHSSSLGFLEAACNHA